MYTHKRNKEFVDVCAQIIRREHAALHFPTVEQVVDEALKRSPQSFHMTTLAAMEIWQRHRSVLDTRPSDIEHLRPMHRMWHDLCTLILVRLCRHPRWSLTRAAADVVFNCRPRHFYISRSAACKLLRRATMQRLQLL